MFWYGGGWSFWQVALMWVGMLAVLGLLGWGIYALVTSSRTRQTRGVGVGGDARAILDARFARGEIDADAYQRARTLLVGGQDGGPDSQAVP